MSGENQKEESDLDHKPHCIRLLPHVKICEFNVMHHVQGPRSNGLCLSVWRFLAVVALSAVTSITVFMVVDVLFPRSGSGCGAAHPETAAMRHTSTSHSCSSSPALGELCHLGVKRLARIKQDVFCEDSHPLLINGACVRQGTGQQVAASMPGGHAPAGNEVATCWQ